MARIVTKIGDVFQVPLDETTKRYIQYVANDMTQLNSSVIRAFKKTYSIDAKPDLNQVVLDEVDFYAHAVLRWGIELGFWEKVGKVPFSGKVDVLFRRTPDFAVKPGKPPGAALFALSAKGADFDFGFPGATRDPSRP